MESGDYTYGWKAEQERDYWVPQCDIEGDIPKDLRGTLLRNGPGLNEVYGTKLKHPIDGDGLVCGLTFCNGKVHFRSKFVQTKHRLEEQEAKEFLYPGLMGTRNESVIKGTLFASLGAISGKFPKLIFRNPSNTNVFYWGGKVLTCYETHLPYCLDPPTLNTIGEDDLGGTLEVGAMAAHFRIDSKEKRLVTISVRPGLRQLPTLAIYEFTENWDLHQKQVHHIAGLNFAHDFLLLPDYYIFHMTPFVKVSKWQAFQIVAGLTSPGETMRLYPELPSRFVIIPRDPEKKDQIIQIDTEPFHIYHFATAEQQGDMISFNAVCLGTDFKMTFDQGIWLGNTSVAPGLFHHFKINLNSKLCEVSKVDDATVEFPSTHPYRHGMPGTELSYLVANSRDLKLPYRDIVKIDSKGRNRQVWYSDGVLGEPVFVPRHGYESSTKGDEDDGFVLVQMFDAKIKRTSFCVLDAKDISKGPVATIKLKHHVPYGFHGTFCPEVFQEPPSAMVKSKL